MNDMRQSKVLSLLTVIVLLLFVAGCCSLHRDPGEPKIVCQPVDVVATNGSAVSLTVKAKGKPPLYFEWIYQANDYSIPEIVTNAQYRDKNVDNSTLHIPTATTNNTGVYTCLVSRDDPRKGPLEIPTLPAHVNIVPTSLMLDIIGWYGTIRIGSQPKSYCTQVPKFVAYSTISPCPNNLNLLWQPASGASQATVTVRDYPDAWIAYKFVGAPTPPGSCAQKHQITFN